MITAAGSCIKEAGKYFGSCRKVTEITGSGSSIPTGKFSDFFRWIPVSFLFFSVRIDQKSSEKVQKFYNRNTASIFQ
jgi:hypothetical protein